MLRKRVTEPQNTLHQHRQPCVLVGVGPQGQRVTMRRRLNTPFAALRDMFAPLLFFTLCLRVAPVTRREDSSEVCLRGKDLVSGVRVLTEVEEKRVREGASACLFNAAFTHSDITPLCEWQDRKR